MSLQDNLRAINDSLFTFTYAPFRAKSKRKCAVANIHERSIQELYIFRHCKNGKATASDTELKLIESDFVLPTATEGRTKPR